MTRTVKISLVSIAIGIIVLASIFPYYYFEWGVKSCQGLPTDPANCGDGDFGGVWFMLLSLPFIGAGLLGLAYALVRNLIRRNKR
jgi:hypothetical protein